LIAVGERIVHPAKRGIGIVGAGRADRSSGQVDIYHQRLSTTQQTQHVALQEGTADLLQGGDDRVQGGGVGGGQGPRDAGIMGEGGLAPAGAHRAIGNQGARAAIEILQVIQPGQDADQELDQFGLRAMVAGLLGEGDCLEQAHQTEVLGELAEQHQQGMLSDQRGGGCRGRGRSSRESWEGAGGLGDHIQHRVTSTTGGWRYNHGEAS
jgi:hypothetical protein